MRERQLKIPTTDGKIIYGVINRPVKETDRLVIMVHALAGDMSSHPFPMAVEPFLQAGYTVVRYNQYSGNKKGRSILDCTTATFCKDLATVIRHFKKPGQKIFLVGHSWGGLQIMRLNPNIAAASLWDPSYALGEFNPPDGAIEPIDKNRVLQHWGTSQAVSKKLNAEVWCLTRESCDNLAKAARFPLQVIQAARYRVGNSYHTHTKTQTDYHILQSNHAFEELAEVPKLINHTINWFNKF